MTRFALVAVALLANTAAFAGDVYNFRIGGQSVRIEQPRNCDEASCMVISIPGVYEQNTKAKKARDLDAEKAAAVVAPAQAPKQSVAVSPAPEKSSEGANGEITAPAAAARPVETAPNGIGAPRVATLAPAPGMSMPAPTTTSPIGVWMTEDNEGKVRIEECGANLCGYLVNAKTNANGDKLLINMKPGKDKWSGKINDPKSGSTYDSTIAMRSDNRLRVQGCAFGGMFCGGQTWTRVN